MEKEKMMEIIHDNIRHGIGLDIKDNNDGVTLTSSKIGGKPSVPADFTWPTCHADWFSEGKYLPLTFFGQFNLEEISKYDKDGILPKKGMLSFFYCITDSDILYGDYPGEMGGAQVFYFEDVSGLVTANFPEDLPESFTITEKAVSFNDNIGYPPSEFMFAKYGLEFPWNTYDECIDDIGYNNISKWTNMLLGHSEYVQHCSEYLCEVVRRGYNACSPDGKPYTDEEEKSIIGEIDNWLQLFQLDPSYSEFDSILGVDGTIHFYIRREDLKAQNFNNVQYIVDCS
jgi:uncharacterized protein YwqG